MNPYVHAPDHVSACDLGPATVVVNYRTGTVHTLLGPSARWWAEVAASGDPASSHALSGQCAKALASKLCSMGVLTQVNEAQPWSQPQRGMSWSPSWGAQELPFGFEPYPPTPRRYIVVALGAVAATWVARWAGRHGRGMARLVRLVGWASRHTRRAATVEQAETAVYAVRRVGVLSPARVACLEESVAVVLGLAVFGRGVRWCHGVAADPIRLHAWVETSSGVTVAERPSTHRYTALLTIPKTRGFDDP